MFAPSFPRAGAPMHRILWLMTQANKQYADAAQTGEVIGIEVKKNEERACSLCNLTHAYYLSYILPENAFLSRGQSFFWGLGRRSRGGRRRRVGCTGGKIFLLSVLIYLTHHTFNDATSLTGKVR